MRIIALTSLRTGNKIYLCVDKIVAVYEHAGTHNSIVQMTGDYDCSFSVKEAPSKVVEMMQKKENMNLLTKDEIKAIRIHMGAYREGLYNQGQYGESMYYDKIVDDLDEMLKNFDEVEKCEEKKI